MGTFDERMGHLMDEVGMGYLRAKCEVNQPYAQNQHESRWFKHNDGRAGYLGDPLMENASRLVEGLARDAISPTGSGLKSGMVDVAEEMARFVFENAPFDEADPSTFHLKLSPHPTVTDNGMVIYDRPPIAPREGN